MAKLTDTQLIILSAASQRPDGLILPLPKSTKLSKTAAAPVLQALLKQKLIAEHPAESGNEVWRQDGGIKQVLKITESALKHLDAPCATSPQKKQQKPLELTKKLADAPAKKQPAKKDARDKKPDSKTKLGQLIDLLSRKGGATIPEAMETTGWQAHSVRGAISGSLKGKLGLTISSEIEGKRGRVYRITGR